MMIVIQDCMPMMADVISGAIPEPEALHPGADVATWARATPAIRKLCEARDVTPAALRVDYVPDGTREVVDGTWELVGALGDPGAVVHLAGRLVVLNVDGTRCAFYAA
jgi:hypothetical protein